MNQVFKNDSSLFSKETLCYNHEHTDNSYKFHKTHSHIYQQKALLGNKKNRTDCLKSARRK